MEETEKIKQAITDFVKGGDNSDIQLLDKVLHKDFRVTNKGFMGAAVITIIDKKEYITKIKSGVFGGLPKTMKNRENRPNWNYCFRETENRKFGKQFYIVQFTRT